MITRAWRVLHLPPHGREALLCLLCNTFTFDAGMLADERYVCGHCSRNLAQVPEDYRRHGDQAGKEHLWHG